MGKRIIQQARGKGGPTYRAPSFRYAGKAKHNMQVQETVSGVVLKFVHCPGHTAPLAEISYDNGEKCFIIAPEGMRLGQKVNSGPQSDIKAGNIIALKELPEGTSVYNIEGTPGDGGKFVRSSGTTAKVVTKMKDRVIVQLPSKKRKEFSAECRAMIGVVAGGGRPEKPILRAGTKYYMMKAKNKLWPRVSGGSMNAVDHPLGNKRSSRKSKGKPVSRNAPPGRKVGLIAARRTGRRKGKRT